MAYRPGWAGKEGLRIPGDFLGDLWLLKFQRAVELVAEWSHPGSGGRKASRGSVPAKPALLNSNQGNERRGGPLRFSED